MFGWFTAPKQAKPMKEKHVDQVFRRLGAFLVALPHQLEQIMTALQNAKTAADRSAAAIGELAARVTEQSGRIHDLGLTISQGQDQVTGLQTQISTLTQANADKDKQIADLQAQLAGGGPAPSDDPAVQEIADELNTANDAAAQALATL